MPPSEQELTDATQRVQVDSFGASPLTNFAPSEPSQPRPVPIRPRRPAEAPRPSAASKKRKQERTAIIVAASVASVLLVALVIWLSLFVFRSPADNQKILSNVFAAGVNIGGMTKEDAKDAIHKATDNTYSHLNMSVTLLDTTVTLSPKDTGAKLDVNALVDAAYDYGREHKKGGSNQPGPYTISILPYLELDTDYIRSVVNELGKKYSTTLTQTRYELTGGERPTPGDGPIDTTVVHQTLVIHMGTAEYGMNPDVLYQQILDAYNINLFQVTGECSMVAPDPIDYQKIYDTYCKAPVNAEFDPDTYLVKPEIYGYGFTLEQLEKAVSSAQYGSDVEIPLTFIKPDITSEFYSDEVFQDTLSSFSTRLPTNPNAGAWINNIRIACEKLNGLILKTGEEFSVNNFFGELTVGKGYQPAELYVGRSLQKIPGGGICQLASTLYNAALLSDLEITEHHTHSYAPQYIGVGFDAEVLFGHMDLKFKNNTEQPIRIEAKIENSSVKVSIIGTNAKNYTVELTYKISKTLRPGTVHNVMIKDNPEGYKEGDVLSEGITGYTVVVTMHKYDRETYRLISENPLGTYAYARKDKVVVKIQEELPPEPSDPTDPSDPSLPSDPTDSTESTDPSETTGPSEPDGSKEKP